MNKQKSKTILITRPLGDEAELRDAVLEMGHHPICEPMSEIFLNHTIRHEIDDAVAEDYDAIILTSKHAAQALAILTDIRDLYILCVGEVTKQLCEDLGFWRVSLAGQNADDMLGYISSCYDDDARILHISGEDITLNFAHELAIYGIEVKRIVVYQAVASEKLSDTVIEQLKRGQIDAVTFFSKRAAQIFIDLLKKEELIKCAEPIDAFCLSVGVASQTDVIDWKAINYADEPTLASLVDCIDNAYR